MSWAATFAQSPARRVALYLEDRLAFTTALFAAWEAGKQVVLPGDALPGTVEALRSQVDAFAGDFAVSGALRAPPPARFAFPQVPAELEREALVVFTSGTTGAPSAIPKRLRQLFDEVATLEATFGGRLGPEARVLATVSHQHIYGLLCTVLWPVWARRPLSAHRLEYPEQLQQAVAEAPCALVTSPAHLKRLPEGPPWPTRLRAVFSSGGPLPAAAAALARAVLGHAPIELYGSSETGGVAWREDPARPWRPMRGVAVRLSAAGTLELSSPHLPGPDWFTTEDRARLEGEGFTLLGRADRLAKVEEKRVSLELVEATARATGLLEEARALPLELGVRTGLGLVGVPTAAARALPHRELAAQLRRALSTVVEAVALPRRYRFVDALPADDRGKVTELALRSLFRPERPTPRWLTRTAARATLALAIGAELRVLDGHFPGVPIVPGVAQLDWAIGLGREAFGLEGAVVAVEALKFQGLLLVGHQPELALEWNAQRATLSFSYTSGAKRYSSGKVVLSR